MTIHTIAPINLDNPPAAPESGAVLFVSVAGVILSAGGGIAVMRGAAEAIAEREHESLHFICAFYESNLIAVAAAKPVGLYDNAETHGRARCLGKFLHARLFKG